MTTEAVSLTDYRAGSRLMPRIRRTDREPTVKMSVYLPESLRQAFHDLAEAQGCTSSHLAMQMIRRAVGESRKQEDEEG